MNNRKAATWVAPGYNGVQANKCLLNKQLTLKSRYNGGDVRTVKPTGNRL